MQKRSSKNLKDVNEIAAFVVASSTSAPDEMPPDEVKPAKNPAAVELGRLGGLKGGKARAASLTEAQRKEIAKRAAEARWKRENREP
ncbi:MAG: hypothetical protein Q8Q12_08890 [bacterium]|nr:hypothetical protein [bacterium]